jgi:hypothetical protein
VFVSFTALLSLSKKDCGSVKASWTKIQHLFTVFILYDSLCKSNMFIVFDRLIFDETVGLRVA